MSRQLLHAIPKRYLIIATLMFGCMSLWSFHSQASDYPDTYDTTGSTPLYPEPPPVTFPETPAPCAPDDTACINTYLDTLSKNVGGGVASQMNPSPVYSSKKQGSIGNCVLSNQQECDTKEADWRNIWMEKAQNMQLDFESPIGTADPGTTCKQEYDWWGYRYYYKCQ